MLSIYAYKDLSLRLPALVLAATPDLDGWRDFGFVVQAYLRDAVPFVERVAALARQRSHRIRVRLAKGAYWDAETARTCLYPHAPWDRTSGPTLHR